MGYNDADEQRARLMAKMEMKRKTRASSAQFYASPRLVRHNSIQVVGLLHQHDPVTFPGENDAEDTLQCRRHSVQVAGMLHTHDPQLLGEERVVGENHQPSDGFPKDESTELFEAENQKQERHCRTKPTRPPFKLTRTQNYQSLPQDLPNTTESVISTKK